MTTPADSQDSRVERIRRVGSLITLAVIVASLVAGLTCSVAGQRQASITAYTIALALMLVLPVSGVVAVLFTEIKRRDWWFAAAAVGVLLLIGYRLVEFFRLIADRVSGFWK